MIIKTKIKKKILFVLWFLSVTKADLRGDLSKQSALTLAQLKNWKPQSYTQ